MGRGAPYLVMYHATGASRTEHFNPVPPTSIDKVKGPFQSSGLDSALALFFAILFPYARATRTCVVSFLADRAQAGEPQQSTFHR